MDHWRAILLLCDWLPLVLSNVEYWNTRLCTICDFTTSDEPVYVCHVAPATIQTY